MLEVIEKESDEAVIKVIGVGGCGGNAVNHMIERNLEGVYFISANTDNKALKQNKAPVLLQIGKQTTKGLGAGAKPSVGREAALEDRESIMEAIRGADMLFIAAGMGGGTGTGAAPVVAEIAKELGILTVAVVTKPFSSEGNRKDTAQKGLEELAQYVDSLIIIPNEKLREVLGENVLFKDAYRAVNEVLYNAVASITEIITVPGLINVDFADVRTVMSERGMAMMGTATASGDNKAIIAVQQAVSNPLLESVSLQSARSLLVNITSGPSMTIKEFEQIGETIKSSLSDGTSRPFSGHIITGHVFDETMNDDIRVTILATGIEDNIVRNKAPAQDFSETSGENQLVEDELYLMFEGSNRSSMRAMKEAMKKDGVNDHDIPTIFRRDDK